MRISKWLLKKTERLENKTVAISGSTGGIGNELALYLASLGASLILLDRNESKIASLSEKIKAIYPKTQISHIKVDLENMDEVKAAAEKLLLSPPDYLILNAGAYSIPRKKCDKHTFINYIITYFLARVK